MHHHHHHDEDDDDHDHEHEHGHDEFDSFVVSLPEIRELDSFLTRVQDATWVLLSMQTPMDRNGEAKWDRKTCVFLKVERAR